MSKRVFIVHGWDGFPEEGWFPWLKTELEKHGFQVEVPQLPQADEPRIKNWVPALAEAVGQPDSQTIFIGHSMGCQTIARFLESLPENTQVGGAVFIAGFFDNLSNLEDDNTVRSVSEEWLTTPLDLKKVSQHLPRSIAIFSDNDPYVPLENQDKFRDILHSIIIIRNNQGHFSGSTGTRELPIALSSILEISNLC